MLHKLLGAMLVVMVAIGCNEPTPETEKPDPVQASLQSDFQDLKKQVLAQALENESLKTEMDRINLQIQDLYFMTKPLRVRVVDREEGNFYLYFMTKPLRVRVVDREEGNFYYAYAGGKIRGMLPSQLPYAELWYLIRSAKGLGYSEAKTKDLVDKYTNMLENPYFLPYKPKYTFYMGELTYHPDLKGYVED